MSDSAARGAGDECRTKRLKLIKALGEKRQAQAGEAAPQHDASVPADADAAECEQLQRVQRALGFSAFASSKGKKPRDCYEGSDGAARFVGRRKYRQYINRKYGCNRPLDNAL